MAIDEDRIGILPEALRPAVTRWFERLEEAHGKVDLAPDVENQLLRVVAVSEFAGNALLRDWAHWQGRILREEGREVAGQVLLAVGAGQDRHKAFGILGKILVYLYAWHAQSD